jgi:hypothetical protein
MEVVYKLDEARHIIPAPDPLAPYLAEAETYVRRAKADNAQWKKVRPNIDYHVEIERHYYSVPYQLVGVELEARYTAATVEIFYHGVRVASHRRGLVPHLATTLHDHRPKSDQAHLEWTPSRLIHWAGTVGPATAQLVQTILDSKRIQRWAIAPASASWVWPRLTRPLVWRRPANAPCYCVRTPTRASNQL